MDIDHISRNDSTRGNSIPTTDMEPTVSRLDKDDHTKIDEEKEEANSNQLDQPVEGESKKKSKKSKKKAKIGTNSLEILESILAKSTFKSRNLSAEVAKKLFEDPVYKKVVEEGLRDVKYESTVDFSPPSIGPDMRISVLPNGFELAEVNIEPSAIINLPCIYETPQQRNRDRRMRRMRNKNKDKKKKKNRNKNDNQNKIPKPKPKSPLDSKCQQTDSAHSKSTPAEKPKSSQSATHVV